MKKKPAPKHVVTVCELCGLDWDRHGDQPTIHTCVELLIADLAAEKRRTAPIQPVLPYPAQPWRPFVPYRPYWISTTSNTAAPQVPKPIEINCVSNSGVYQ